MRYRPIKVFLISALCFLPSAFAAHAALWSGIIAPPRAMDWSQAGIPSGIPSGSWTQCGSTIAAYSGTADVINSALSKCGANQYVLLGPGSFTLSTSIDFVGKNHVVLRGSGANSTFLTFSAASAIPSCNTGSSQFIGICGNGVNWWSSPTVYNWTAGYAQGSSQITLSGSSGISTLSSGDPTLLILNQDDDGYAGYPAGGSAVDNGNYFVCADAYAPSPAAGCSYNGPDGTPPSPFTHRWQEEIGVATAVSGGVVTLAQPLKHPNWRSGQSQTAMLMSPTVVSSGIENLSIDMGGNASVTYAIDFWGAYQCWVSGVRVMNIYKGGIGAQYSSHLQIQNNYIFNAVGSDPYAIDFAHTADSAIVNNIIQKIRVSILFDGPDEGSVMAYNYHVNDSVASDDMFPGYWDHSASNDFHLWEGNAGAGVEIDDSHGTHLDETLFRNFLTGWESCANGQCGSSPAKDFGTAAIGYLGYNRYGNIIGNIAGTPGYSTVYQTSSFGGNQSVYYLGAGNPSVSPSVPADPLTASTSFRWGNWDAVNAATQWNLSEVPAGLSLYANPVPSDQNLPASFYLSSKPSWWGSTPWPAIGPDVNGGNVGQCTGVLNTAGHFSGVAAMKSSQCTGTTFAAAWAGHVNAIPAMACYLNVMSGAPDGTGTVLAFDATTCYGSQSQPANACDLNSDGSVNAADVQQAVNQALGTIPCGTADLQNNGTCNVVDVQRVANAALGGTCVMGQ